MKRTAGIKRVRQGDTTSLRRPEAFSALRVMRKPHGESDYHEEVACKEVGGISSTNLEKTTSATSYTQIGYPVRVTDTTISLSQWYVVPLYTGKVY
ncbi:hypothetical protein EJB05_32099 [Eragrostis curvula]|uniref:Uncharacterized protein n=1 Tax=Eragrostis curvula TaxID=38414 RepID=A0A5J9UF84_9POAL|nr:hypothetical protein EJB05_32099 [Eragrostis curvula]